MLHLGHDAFQYKLPKTLLHELKNAPTCTTTDDSFDVHINENERTLEQNTVPSAAVDVTQVETVVHSYFSMLTTTSPNSVLLASLDAARAQFEEHGAEMVQQAALAVNRLRAKLRTHGKPTYVNINNCIF